MSIAGIDLSSRAVDVVLLEDDGDRATWHRFELAGATPFERARSLRRVFPTRSWWEENGVWLLGIEDPHSRFPHVAKALGMATGGVAALLPSDLTVIQTKPNEWQSVFLVDKALYVKSVDRKEAITVRALSLGFDTGIGFGDPQDAYDAYGIAWAIRKINAEAARAAEGEAAA